MTLREKIGQLEQIPWPNRLSPAVERRIQTGEIGSFLGLGGNLTVPAATALASRNRAQRIAMDKSRLGIPLLFAFDVVHGYRTIFPIPLGTSCSWNPSLEAATQRVAAKEAWAVGLDWAFSPMINIARDARWGRIAEGFGVDPLLDARMTMAAVRGFQGRNPAAPGRVAACLKHFVGYGDVEGGRDYTQTDMSRFTLRNYYLPAFRAGVRAGALSIMSAFNAIGGIPMSADHFTLRDVLRDQWRFKGCVVSDWGAITELQPWGFAASKSQAAREAIRAGVDVEMSSDCYQTLIGQVRDGRVPMRWINRAVRHVLYMKFKLGLFDQPYRSSRGIRAAFLKPAYRQLALKAGEESCVLLKNADHILPLLGKDIHHILLVGPYADDQADMLGCWAGAGHSKNVISVAAGLGAALPSNCQLTVLNGKSVHAAVTAAASADVIVVTLGEPASWCGEDRSVLSLRLVEPQRRLFAALVKCGKPVVVLLFNGRPLAIPTVAAQAGAILECWYPGVEAGPAIAGILLGKFNPCGRLTTDFPYATGQEPLYYDHPNTGRPDGTWTSNKYVDGPAYPLYPFGYGLSYTKFKFGLTRVSSWHKPGGAAIIRTRVTNVGKVSGIAVVQLYLRAPASSGGVRACRQLAGFKRVNLAAGNSQVVTFKLSRADLGFWNIHGKWTIAPGRYDVWISPCSGEGMFWCTPDVAKTQPASFTIRW
jgi:beta-glucosidase